MPEQVVNYPELTNGSLLSKDSFIGIVISRDDIKYRQKDLTDTQIDLVFEHLREKFTDILCETDFYWDIIDSVSSSATRDN